MTRTFRNAVVQYKYDEFDMDMGRECRQGLEFQGSNHEKLSALGVSDCLCKRLAGCIAGPASAS